MASSITVNPTLGYIRIRVPQHYTRQPIVSRLISRYNLTINIAAALLEAHTRDDGWFNLEIQGSCQQVEAGLAYLMELDVEIVQLNITSLVNESMEKLQILGASSVDADLENSSHQMQNKEKELELTVVEGQTNRARFQVCIPKNYHSYPVIAGLVSYYGLTVNITAASLDTEAKDDGWFDLELWGQRQQIASGLKYLKQLGLQIWL